MPELRRSPRWSGQKTVRLRASRSGNRQLNVALYRIAMTQMRRNGHGEAYYRKRRDAGDSHAAALRRLERRIVRSIFGQLRTDHINQADTRENMGPLTKPGAAPNVRT